MRPFTLRGLSPDHTLVLLNGWRRHQTALVNNFTYGMGAGSSGVDLNAIPSSALDRIEVLRDGAAAQYGSDAIAGVVNLVLKDGAFTPFVNGDIGRYTTDNYPDDGTTSNVNGGWGSSSAGARWVCSASSATASRPTGPGPTGSRSPAPGVADSINDIGQVVHKNNPVPQPNHHWGDGLEKDALTLRQLPHAGERSGHAARSTPSAATATATAPAIRFRRYCRQRTRTGTQIYPLGFLPDDQRPGDRLLDGRRAPRRGVGLELRPGRQFGHNHFDYHINNTLNASLGPCLDRAPCAPGPDGILGTADDPGIPNQTSFFAGRPLREEFVAAQRREAGRRSGSGTGQPRLRRGVPAGALRDPAGRARLVHPRRLPPARTAPGRAPAGSQVFPGFTPSDATDRHRNNFGVYADAETDLSTKLLANVAARFEDYSDFGSRVSGKAARPLPALAPGDAPRRGEHRLPRAGTEPGSRSARW